MSERLLIAKVKRTNATQAELYAKGHKFPDLKLFDLSELLAVGIDPEGLPVGEERPVRFWALYELSDKLNQKGNPYKDVVSLEAIAGPGSAPAGLEGELLAELREIKALLADLLAEKRGGQKENGNGHDPLDVAFPRYLDGQPVGDNPAEVEAFNDYLATMETAPASIEELRTWVKAQRKNGKGQGDDR